VSDLSDFMKVERPLHEKLDRNENPTLEEWFAYLNFIGDAAHKAATTDDPDLAAELVESIASWAWAPEDVHKFGEERRK
jgi:hypothetical protein